MSKLSEPLKQLINAAHAKPNTIPAPKHIVSVYEKIAQDAATKKIGLPAWLSASTAATMTLNSPESLLHLHNLASSHPPPNKSITNQPLYTAELIREIGLKCIGFNGVPRTINVLGSFFKSLPGSLQEELRTRQPRRHLSPQNIEATLQRGDKLWDSIYHPFTAKLTASLAQSHPDLPVHIIESEYGCLFSDPPSPLDPHRPNIGRVLTSIVAVACLRSQSGVGPQVVSHVFGLRKAFEDGTAEKDVQGGEWLASNEGSMWLLEQVDAIVEAIGGSFAPGWQKEKAKL